MTTPRDTTNATRRPTAATTFVVGGGVVGREVAAQLSAQGESVTRVVTTPPADAQPGYPVHVVESLDAEGLATAGLDDAGAVVVLEADDARNLLVAQLARTRFGVDRVLVRVDDPEREPLYERLGVDVVDTTLAIADTAVDQW
jgi:Trk K+ transport system NAD-binding subunit